MILLHSIELKSRFEFSSDYIDVWLHAGVAGALNLMLRFIVISVASLAQSVERETLSEVNLKVAGSTPAWG